MEFSVNHPILFVIVGMIIAVVVAQSVYFLIKAYRRALELGIDKSVLKKTIISLRWHYPNQVTGPRQQHALSQPALSKHPSFKFSVV